MFTIIQDFAKIINSRISNTFLVYLGMICMLCIGFTIGRSGKIIVSKPELRIVQSSSAHNFNATTTVDTADRALIFGSHKGKYFYYKGCGGGSISPKNLVYYKSESEALAAGKTLYSKCK